MGFAHGLLQAQADSLEVAQPDTGSRGYVSEKFGELGEPNLEELNHCVLRSRPT